MCNTEVGFEYSADRWMGVHFCFYSSRLDIYLIIIVAYVILMVSGAFIVRSLVEKQNAK